LPAPQKTPAAIERPTPKPKLNMNTIKPKIETKSVRHNFTPEETNNLNLEFRRAYDGLKSVEAEFDSVKATFKARTAEASSRMETLAATLNAGFEMRPEKCRLVLAPKEAKKLFYLESAIDGQKNLDANGIPEGLEPVLVEAMTPSDFQNELIEAESRFDHREEIPLFLPVKDDSGILAIGRLNKLWYAALRVTLGTRILNERLDSEQPACRKRFDMVKQACKRFNAWLEANLGPEGAKGFQNSIADVLAKHREREE